MAHRLCIDGWIEEVDGSDKRRVVEGSTWPGHLTCLGYLLKDEDRQRAVQMFQQALQGFEKARGPEHISTLDTVNNLGNLYKDLGRLNDAEKMYQRALDGYEKAISPRDLVTFVPALKNMWAFASLRESQGRVDDTRHWYSQALVGYGKTFGPDHDKCKPLRNKLGKRQSCLANGASIEHRSVRKKRRFHCISD
jgi:tetratricopeptide (TPR) repeat protein